MCGRILLYEIGWLFLINSIRRKHAKLSIAIEVILYLYKKIRTTKNLSGLILEITFAIIVMNICFDNQTSLLLEVCIISYQVFILMCLRAQTFKSFLLLSRSSKNNFSGIPADPIVYHHACLKVKAGSRPAFFMHD